MTYYRGSRVPLSERASRAQTGTGWRERSSFRGGRAFFLKLFGPAEGKRAAPSKTYAFYRPGVTPAADAPAFPKDPKGEGAGQRPPFRKAGGLATPGFSKEKRAWVLKAPALQGAKWILQWAGVALLVAAVTWSKSKTTALLQDAAGMKLEKVSVEGTHYLSDGQVVKAVALTPGENMFKLDLEQANERVKQLDWVDRAFIERRLPRSILVSIRERRPVALLDDGALYGVDAQGRVLSPSPALLQEDLPLVSGVPLAAEAVGTTREARALKPALDFFAFLQKEDPALAQDVSEVNLSQPDALKVTFIDGIQATFNSEVSDGELKRMALVLSDLSRKGKKAGALDFRYSDMVLVKTR